MESHHELQETSGGSIATPSNILEQDGGWWGSDGGLRKEEDHKTLLLYVAGTREFDESQEESAGRVLSKGGKGKTLWEESGMKATSLKDWKSGRTGRKGKRLAGLVRRCEVFRFKKRSPLYMRVNHGRAKKKGDKKCSSFSSQSLLGGDSL